jgi:hypothetical protein
MAIEGIVDMKVVRAAKQVVKTKMIARRARFLQEFYSKKIDGRQASQKVSEVFRYRSERLEKAIADKISMAIDANPVLTGKIRDNQNPCAFEFSINVIVGEILSSNPKYVSSYPDDLRVRNYYFKNNIFHPQQNGNVLGEFNVPAICLGKAMISLGDINLFLKENHVHLNYPCIVSKKTYAVYDHAVRIANIGDEIGKFCVIVQNMASGLADLLAEKAAKKQA